MEKKLKGGHEYFAILCFCVGHSRKPKPMICGVYADLFEAKEVAKGIKRCGAKHQIVKCSVQISY